MKSLDAKLASIHAAPASAPDFILADAKDADMAAGLAATGADPVTGQPRSLADYDAFFLLEDARRHGARAALFGRKINNSEHQLTFVRWLRAIADGEVDAAEACRAYHDDLAKLGITPHRPLAEDLELTGTSAAYAS